MCWGCFWAAAVDFYTAHPMVESQHAEKTVTLREQGGAVLGGVRESVLHATRHVEALAELLQVELNEYGRRQARRLTAALVGVALLLCAYLMLCVFAVLVLMPVLKPIWAPVLAVVIFNALVGMVALLVSKCGKPGGVAPETVKELKNDLECVKLYLKGKENS